MTYEEVLKKLELTEDEYILALRSSIRQPKAFLRRELNERNVNNYNKELLELWEGNMDIQLILDPYSTCGYVCNYQNKGQKGMSKLMKDIAHTIHRGNMSLQQTIRLYVNEFIRHSEISAQEAVYHLLGIPMAWCSKGQIYINTLPPEKRQEIKKNKEKLLKIMEMDPDSTDTMEDGLIDHYIQRPDELNHVTLADFASKYIFTGNKIAENKMGIANSNTVSEKVSVEDDISDHECQEESEKFICNTKFHQLKDKSGYVRERQPRIIRFRNYRIASDESNYYRENVMLFIPWTNEQHIIDNAEEIYKANVQTILNQKNKYYRVDPDKFENAITEEPNDNDDSDSDVDDNTEISKAFRYMIYELMNQTLLLIFLNYELKTKRYLKLLTCFILFQTQNIMK